VIIAASLNRNHVHMLMMFLRTYRYSGRSVKDKEGRMYFMRATLDRSADGTNVVTSVGSKSSDILMSMVNADVLMVVPASSAGLSEGEKVRVQLLFGSDFQQQPDLEI
jgi:molybdopterin biosynthesis enzyme